MLNTFRTLGFSLVTIYWLFTAANTVKADESSTGALDLGATVDVKAATDEEINQIYQAFNLPSLSVAIAINNKVRYQKAVGFADVASAKPATRNTQYSVGSVAKPITGLALMRLVQEGKVVLTDNLAKHDTDLATRFSQITLQQLASHTAGIKHNTPERDVLEYELVQDHKSPLEAYVTFKDHDLLFAPGKGFKYSSNGYILLSGIIESIADENFHGFVRKQVFRPLNMTGTRLDNSVNSDADEASYYESWQQEGGYTLSTTQRDRSFLFGAGGYMSTPTDLVRMASAMFDENYLRTDLVEQMLTPVRLASGEENEQTYAIGWRVGDIALNEEQSTRVAHHGGVTDKAATAYILVVPEKKAAVAFATNMVPPKFWQIRGKVARILLNWINSNSESNNSRGAAQ